MANQAIGFGSLLAGGVLIAAAITGKSLTAVMTGQHGGPSPLGGDGTQGSGSTAPDPEPGSDAGPTAKGTKLFDGKPVAAWIVPALAYGRAHGWTGTVNSGWRSFAEQTRIFNSGVKPAAKPGTSNHEGDAFPRGAVDVSEAESLAAALKGSPWEDLLIWAGAKDPVHFSHPHDGSY